MKKAKKIILGLLAVTVLMSTTGCYGSFSVTNKLYKWNGSVGDKWINSVLFFGMAVFQVYTFCLFVDGVVLNTIEFWTGSNPISMNEGESDSQMVLTENGKYVITATKNQFHIEQTEGLNAGKSIDLLYNTTETAWYATDGIETVKLAQGDINNNQWVKVFYPNGKVEEIAIQ
ncbi:MAG: DUF3332 domain-containing protein [Salinivirgaceae bacterium]